MPVEILEAAAVHEAVIDFRSRIGLAASGDCLLHNGIDAFAALDRQTQQRLDLAVRLNDSLRAELGEVRVAQDHEHDGIGLHHRCSGAGPAEAQVFREADGLVECGGFLHIGDRQVDEDHFRHGASRGLSFNA